MESNESGNVPNKSGNYLNHKKLINLMDSKNKNSINNNSINKKSGDLKVMFLNVRGRMKHRMHSPIMKDYISKNNPDIIALVETKNSKSGSLPNIMNYSKFSKGAKIQNNHPSGGIAFYFHNRLKRSIQRLKIVRQHNILWVRLRTNSRDLTIGTIYCRNAEQKYKDEISEFYEVLTRDTLKYAAAGDVLLLGDFNARLGDLTGDHAVNSNKEEFLAFLHTTKMINLNIIHAKGEYTYQDDRRGGKSIIDFGLINSESLNRVTKFHKLDYVFGSDHRALEAHIKLDFRLELNHEAVVRRWSQISAKNAEKFRIQIQNKLQNFTIPMMPSDLSIEERTGFLQNIHRSFFDTYDHIKRHSLGKCRRNFAGGDSLLPPKLKRLYSLRTSISRTLALLEKHGDPSNAIGQLRLLYGRTDGWIEQEHNALEKKEWEHTLQRLEQLDFQTRTREFWKTLKHLRSKRAECFTPNCIKGPDGTSSSTTKEFQKYWADFYKHLYSIEGPFDITQNSKNKSDFEDAKRFIGRERHNYRSVPAVFNRSITREEFDRVLGVLGTGKAPGPDGMTNDEILQGGPVLHDLLFAFMKLYWAAEMVPDKLQELVLTPLVKDLEGDVHDPSNYRPIALLNGMFKLFEAILQNRICNFLENKKLLADEQHGFRAKRGTNDPLFVVREVIEEYRLAFSEKRRPLYFCFLDIKKAFDRVSRPWVWHKMHKMGLRGKIWRTIINMFSNIRGRVKVDDIFSQLFSIETGVVQGSRLGPTLFSLFINELIQEVKSTTQGATFSNGTRLQILCFADDILLISDTPDDLQKMVDVCYNYACRHSFKFSIKKSKIMIIHHKPKKHQNLQWNLGKDPLERVTTYKYLGVDLCQCVGLGSNALPYKQHHARLLSKAETRLNMVKHLGMCKDGLQLPTAIKLYKLLVRPIVEYAAPSLTWSESQFQVYERFQLKALKSLIGLQKCGTSSAAVRLLAGVEPIKARFDYLKMKYFQKLRMMDKDRIVRRIFEHRFATANSGLCAEVRYILGDHAIFHEHKTTSIQDLTSFAYFIKSKILQKAYHEDCVGLSKSKSAEVFNRLYFKVGTYLKAKPQSFRFGRELSASTNLNECGRYEARKSRTGFYQGLLGKHPLHFTKLEKCPHCGNSPVSIFDHALFDCDFTQSKRVDWISQLETDILSNDLPDFSMNLELFNILKETTLPPSQRRHQCITYKLIAFGGHDVHKCDRGTVVTRRRKRRLGVSDLLSSHTAALLQSVYLPISKDARYRVLPDS